MEIKEYVGQVSLWKFGFGFIRWYKGDEIQDDIFVHYSHIDTPTQYKSLSTGDYVRFTVDPAIKNDKGLIATKVKPITKEEYESF